jgi:hypothetical protein
LGKRTTDKQDLKRLNGKPKFVKFKKISNVGAEKPASRG